MPTPSFFINPHSGNLKTELIKLRPTPGYCMFIDIAGSTKMKQDGFLNWVALIHNCFANAQTFLLPFSPVKEIGDAIMFYVEDGDLQRSGYVPLQLFDGLWKIATETDHIFPAVKIGAARCENAYSITFRQGNQDYYGIDIDMAARIQGEAQERQVVIERRLYDNITTNYNATGNKDNFESYRSLSGPVLRPLKGIPHEVELFRAGL